MPAGQSPGLASAPASPAALSAADPPAGAARAAAAGDADPTAPRHPHPIALRIVPPRRLRAGDRVGLVAPASPPEEAAIELALANVRALGLEPVLGERARDRCGYLAGTDAARASDFNRMARDPQIRAIFALRGGYGAMRLLDALDYDALARDPKIVMGYSDCTAILNAVTCRSGIVTLHGPVAGASWDGALRARLERALFDARPLEPMRAEAPQRIVTGRAKGRLFGGNLALVAALCGTRYAIPARDALLFLEEIGEAPYRIDRMLTTLRLAGTLERAAGIVAGAFVECDDPRAPAASATANDAVAERLRAAGRPALGGAPFGHIASPWVLPIGVLAELDVEAGTLAQLEAAVAGE